MFILHSFISIATYCVFLFLKDSVICQQFYSQKPQLMQEGGIQASVSYYSSVINVYHTIVHHVQVKSVCFMKANKECSTG